MRASPQGPDVVELSLEESHRTWFSLSSAPGSHSREPNTLSAYIPPLSTPHMENIFSRSVSDLAIARINRLQADTAPKWGKMNVGQMLAHCNCIYEMVYDPEYAKRHPPPNAFVRTLLKLFLKPVVVGPKPYKRNSRTAPEFLITDERDFTEERERMIAYINRTQELGAAYFEGKHSPSFGALTSAEWNVLFHKHLDHHLRQFGV